MVSGIFVVAASVVDLGAVVENALEMVVIAKVVVVFFSIMLVQILFGFAFEGCFGCFLLFILESNFEIKS